MPKRQRLIHSAPLSLSLLMLAAPSAFAQTPDDEVIVTATKIEKSVLDLGLSVTVIDGENLSELNGAEELSQKVPGLQAAVANGSQVAFQIRGIGAVDHQALTPTAAASAARCLTTLAPTRGKRRGQGRSISTPPMYGTSASGTRTEPSAC